MAWTIDCKGEQRNNTQQNAGKPGADWPSGILGSFPVARSKSVPSPAFPKCKNRIFLFLQKHKKLSYRGKIQENGKHL